MLIHLYSSYTDPNAISAAKGTKPVDRQVNGTNNAGRSYRDEPLPNGHAWTPGSAAERQARELQEFELEALMSDEEDENGAARKVNGRL